MLYSKAEMLRTCWKTRTGIGNELFEDESSVGEIYKDETLLWVFLSRTC